MASDAVAHIAAGASYRFLKQGWTASRPEN